MKRNSGLTLVELLVVLAIVAITTAGAIWSMRQSPQRQLEQEAWRLAALLEAARGQAALQNQVVTWSVDAQGRFVWQGPVAADLPIRWESDDSIRVLWPAGVRQIVLGPEPMVPAIRITLEQIRNGQPLASVRLGTDGLAAFAVLNDAPAEPSSRP